MDFMMRKPKTTWERRKEKLQNFWNVFKQNKAGLVGIAILILFVLMALAGSD